MANGVIIPSSGGTGWNNISTGTGRNVRYCMDGTTVYVCMDSTDNTGSAATIGTIPDGFRPNQDISITAWSDGTNYRIYYITASTGVIKVYSNINWVAPAMVSYPLG